MANAVRQDFIDAGGARIEITRRGAGAPLLVLHGEEALERDSPAIAELAGRFEVIMPSYPGFGASDRPEWMTTTDDLAFTMLDVVDALKLPKLPVIGFGLGGWIAADLATKSDAVASRLVLVDALGVKVGGPYDQDIQDIWYHTPDKVLAMRWADPAKGKRDFTGWSDEQLAVVARNTESFARFCWDPYMHNPKLRHRLHRIKAPTLVLWGEKDGMASPDYGKAYSKLIPGARFEIVRDAGHYPHLEQPQAFLSKLMPFLG
jgi:pimeloyl-ACP methyl ester carboxylesterase